VASASVFNMLEVSWVLRLSALRDGHFSWARWRLKEKVENLLL